jgi:uncharacterized integral membrane protein (TIGR00698 family)
LIPASVTDRTAVSEPARPPLRAAVLTRVPGLAVVALLAAIAFVVTEWIDLSPLVVGIGLGAAGRERRRDPAVLTPGIAFAARSILRAGVVLLGLRLSLGDLAGLGADGLVVVAMVVTITFFGTQWLARRLGIGAEMGLLVATGYSICGASAIAAVNGVVHADEEETAYAITLVTLCGTLSIVALPAIAELVGLTGAAFGTWVGGAVHDVGQVVATASHGDAAALQAATVVKLTRVVLLAPLVAIVSRSVPAGAARRPLVGRQRSATSTSIRRSCRCSSSASSAAIAVRTTGVLGDGALDLAAQVEKILLTVALVAMGLGVRIARMRRLGARPLALGLLAWILVAATAYAGQPLTDPARMPRTK